MAFFDDLGKKLTSVSQTAVQKTKDVADIAKINAEISELERTANHLYFQIGKLYVAKHTADYESDFAGMIGSVIESERKIAECRQRIQDIKGVVCCEKCGAEISAGSAFCSFCGAPSPKSATSANAQNLEKCASCGAMIPRGTRFCTACGKPMLRDVVPPVSAEQAPAEQVPEAQTPAEPAPTESTPIEQRQTSKTCSSCGAVNEPDCTFCTECGNKL